MPAESHLRDAPPARELRAASANAAAIEVHAVGQRFGQGAEALEALVGIDLRIASGDFVSLIGPSGCGKSTLLRCCAGLLQPSAGAVSIAGRPPTEARRRHSVGVVFQDPALLPWRSVRDNIALPLQIAGHCASEAAIERLLDLVGLGGFGNYRPHQLSGGMKQRVAIARALVLQPSVLLMDEPFAALDEISRAEMREELLRIWRARPTTVLFVTHSIGDAVLLSDRVVVMSPRPGRIIAEVPIELQRPRGGELEYELPFLRYAAELRELLRSQPR